MRSALVCPLVLLASLAVHAEVPSLINYQGRLLSGTNLVNGSVGLSLRLFNASSGGVPLFEDSNSVAVVDGLYSTAIGDNPTGGSLVSALTNAAVYVEVAVNGTALSPRERLAAVGYSLATRGLLVTTNRSVVLNPDQNSMDDTVACSIIGGGCNNDIGNGASFATVAGGFNNDIGTNSHFSAIGGGGDNDIGDGSWVATIAGGIDNDIGTNSDYSAIGGGSDNDIGDGASFATIAGGGDNGIGTNSSASTIGGGDRNRIGANAGYAAIPGGRNNAVGNGATNAFAAGRRAKANHPGAFVWADGTDADFASSADNQFLIRASGGVGIGTNNPAAQLDVSSSGGDSAPQVRINQESLADFARMRFTLGGQYSNRWDVAVQKDLFVIYSGHFSAEMLRLDAAGLTAAGNVQAGVFIGSGAGLTDIGGGSMSPGGISNAALAANAVTGDKIAAGTISNADLSVQTLANTFWRLDGNEDTIPGPHFIGTKDYQPVEVKVNGTRALRIELKGSGTGGAPNLIGGAPVNSMGANVFGSVICGGGATNYLGNCWSNRLDADFAIIGGGTKHHIEVSADWSAIVGGSANLIQNYADYAFIGGGALNTIQDYAANAFIGGGARNSIGGSSPYSVIPGGRSNSVGNGAAYAFAAGYRAKANHAGTFVWADKQEADFASTADNQFLIRAAGGVGIGSESPAAQLAVSSGGGDSSPQVRIDQQSLSDYARLRFTLGGQNDKRWDVAVQTNLFVIYSAHFGAEMLRLDTAGLTVRGTFVSSSDRNLKENYEPVDPQEILEKVAALPVSRWN